MRPDIKLAKSVEVAIYPSADRTKWVAYCATFNLTGWGFSRKSAILSIRRELEAEERCPDDFPASMGPPAPADAELQTIARLRTGEWL